MQPVVWELKRFDFSKESNPFAPSGYLGTKSHFQGNYPQTKLLKDVLRLVTR